MLRSFAGGALFGEAWADPPPQVLALHGWRRTHQDFSGVLGPSAAGGPAPTLAVDLPGFGSSPPPPMPWSSADYAELLARVLERELGGASVVVLGHSFGGRVGLTLAATRPDLVSALVLTGAPVARVGAHRPRQPPTPFRVVRTLRRAGLVSEARLERARQRYGSADYRAAAGVMRQVLVTLLAETYDDRLRALRCPVELVWGDDDTEAPLAVAHAAAALAPDARVTVCPGAGHLTPLTAPADLRAAVERARRAAADRVEGAG